MPPPPLTLHHSPAFKLTRDGVSPSNTTSVFCTGQIRGGTSQGFLILLEAEMNKKNDKEDGKEKVTGWV